MQAKPKVSFKLTTNLQKEEEEEKKKGKKKAINHYNKITITIV